MARSRNLNNLSILRNPSNLFPIAMAILYFLMRVHPSAFHGKQNCSKGNFKSDVPLLLEKLYFLYLICKLRKDYPL